MLDCKVDDFRFQRSNASVNLPTWAGALRSDGKLPPCGFPIAPGAFYLGDRCVHFSVMGGLGSFDVPRTR